MCARIRCHLKMTSRTRGERLNGTIIRNWQERTEPLQLARSRPSHKHDNADVEQKNWMWRRQLFGLRLLARRTWSSRRRPYQLCGRQGGCVPRHAQSFVALAVAKASEATEPGQRRNLSSDVLRRAMPHDSAQDSCLGLRTGAQFCEGAAADARFGLNRPRPGSVSAVRL